MISDQLHQELNKQLNMEFAAANAYLAMAAYCSSESYDGFANFFIVQAEEERFHAMKIYHYLNMIGKRCTIDAMPEPKNTYDSILECFEDGLQQEKEVTKRIYHLSDIALNEREHATMNFLKWFIDEQIEEEDSFDTIIQTLKRIGKDTHAFILMDQEFAKRTFNPAEEG